MTSAEYASMRVEYPFPWSEQVFQHHKMGGIVRVVAANGREVPIFTMTKFLAWITTALSRQPGAPT